MSVPTSGELTAIINEIDDLALSVHGQLHRAKVALKVIYQALRDSEDKQAALEKRIAELEGAHKDKATPLP